MEDGGRTSIWLSTLSTPSIRFMEFSASDLVTGFTTAPSSVTVDPSTLKAM